MKETRLLHFRCHPHTSSDWQLVEPNSKGIPVDMGLQSQRDDMNFLTNTFQEGFLQALAKILGPGGMMEGWQLQAIGKCYYTPEDVKNAVVIVTRDVTEAEKENTGLVKEENDSDWIATPSTMD
ncbi:MAG: hypothetical protein Q9220_006858 [cf. Caloplaca sp. 1 TL-2023]